MATVGSANVEITANSSDARREVSGFMGFLQKAGAIATGVAGGLAIFQAVGDSFRSLKENTIGANASMEQYETTLSVVLKSQEKAVEMLAWAEKFAAETPFEIPDIVEATTRLESYGLSAQKVLGSTGDMAAVMGKPLMQAVEAVADAQTGELERLKEFGITKKMLIEQAAKMGKNEVVNAKGQITDMEGFNEALFALMEERFQGGMELQSKTFNGMISNVKDSMGTIGRILSRPLFEKLKSGLSSAVPVLSAAAQAIRGDWTGVKKTLEGAFGPDTALKIENFFLKIGAGVNQAKQWFKSFSPTIDNFKNILKGLMPVAQIVGGAIAIAFLGIAKVLPPVVNAITGIAAAFTSWSGFAPLVTGLTAAFVSFKATVMIINGVKKAMVLFQTVLWGVRNAAFLLKYGMVILNTAFLANPIAIVVAALVGLGVAFFVAYKKSETFRNIVNGAWNSLKTGFSAVINWFTETLPAWVQSVVTWFTNLKNSVVAQVTAFSNGVKSGFSSFFQTVMNLLQPFITFFINSWNNLKLVVLGIVLLFVSLLTGNFEQMKIAILGIVTGFKNQVSNIFTLLKNTIVKLAVAIATGILNNFNKAKSWAISTISSLFIGAVNLFNRLRSSAIASVINLATGIRNGFSNAKNYAINMITGLYNGVTNWIGKIPGKISSMTSKMLSILRGINLYNIGRDLIQGLVNGIGSMATSVKNKIKDIGDSITGKMKKILKLGSPSRLFKDYGKWTFEGYIIGADKMIGGIKKVAEKAGNAIKPDVKPLDMSSIYNGLNKSSIVGGFRKIKASFQGGSGSTHNHYWNVDAENISSVQKLISIVNGVAQDITSR